jgi:flagellar biosynthesis component FlhA
MDDITKQPKPNQRHITDQTPAGGTPDLDVPHLRVKTDFQGYVLVVLGVAAVTVLMAVIGGLPLVGVVGVITVLAIVHYWTWGRSLGRRAQEEHARQFREQLEIDRDHLSEVERPRHY